MSIYVTDTHPLIYYDGRSSRHLSDRARTVFQQAENGEALILIPAPALWEVSMLEQAGHIKLNSAFAKWQTDLLQKPCFDCVPLDAENFRGGSHLQLQQRHLRRGHCGHSQIA